MCSLHWAGSWVSTSEFQGINWKFIFGELIWIWFEPCSSLLCHCWPQKLGAEHCRRLGNKTLGSVSQIPEHPDILGLWLRVHLHFGSLLMGSSLFLWELGSWAALASLHLLCCIFLIGRKKKKACLFFFDVWSIPSERSGVYLKPNKGKKYLYKGKIPACPKQKYRNSRVEERAWSLGVLRLHWVKNTVRMPLSGLHFAVRNRRSGAFVPPSLETQLFYLAPIL